MRNEAVPVGLGTFFMVFFLLDVTDDVSPATETPVVEKMTEADPNQILHTFQSVSECMEHDKSLRACIGSQKVARQLAKEAVEYHYATQEECEQQHTTCADEGEHVMPVMVAWQATQDDITKVIPLFSSPKEGTAMRRSGVHVSF